MAEIAIFNPESIRAPTGTYSHIGTTPAGASLVVISGQVGIGLDGGLPDGFEEQCERVFANLEAALEASGAGWANVVQTMSFLTRRDDLPAFREWRTREFARLFPDGRYPPSTLLIVSGLADERMLIEVQALAAI